MEASEVQDIESLRRYLETLPDDKRREVAVRVAFRAAARVLPFAVRLFARTPSSVTHDLTPLPLFASITFSGVASRSSTPTAGRFVDTNAATRAFAAVEAYEDVDYSACSAIRAAIRVYYDSNADLAARAARAAAKAAYGAASTAAADAATQIDFWSWIRLDIDHSAPIRLWLDCPPTFVIQEWANTKTSFEADPTADWSFWIAWYERVLAGRDTLPDALAPVFNELTKEDWEKGPAHINPMFDDVLAMYRAEDALIPSLEDATPVDFTFDALARVMRMIGIDDQTAHLRRPEVVQNFLDDAAQLCDGIQDFVDYASALSSGGNYAGVLRLGAEKVLKEFQHVADLTHIRAARVVTLASDLEVFSKDGRARADLGDALADRLDSRIDELKTLCRRHFAPSLSALAPLADLNFDQIDQAEVLRVFDGAITWIDRLPSDDMIALDADGIAVLRDMRRELDDFRAAIAEASTDEFKLLLQQRLAQSAGSLGLTLIRFRKRSAAVSARIGRSIDTLNEAKGRFEGLWDIIQSVKDFLS